MSLSVIDTITQSVTSYPGGTISIRCADWVADPRGTLSVVTDADSLSGQVVHETQLVAYDTSAGFGPPLPADYEFVDVDAADVTLSIPLANLPLNTHITYVAYMNWKVAGAGSAGHRIGEDFMLLSVQDQVLFGFNDTVDASIATDLGVDLQRPTTNPRYRMTWFQYIRNGGKGWQTSSGATATDLLVMAAAGEDSTYECWLDAIFLVPYLGDTSPLSHYIEFMGDPAIWEPLTDNQTGDPTATSAPDDVEASNGLTTATQDAQFSVIPTDSNGFCTGFSACGSDYQRLEDEGSFTDMMQFLWNGTPTWPDDPQSWIVMTAGPKLIPAHTIETETFGTNVTPDENHETFASTSGSYYWEITNDQLGTSTALVTGGQFSVSGVSATTLSRGAWASLGTQTFPSDSATHMNAKQTLFDMSNGIIEGTAQITSVPANTMYAIVGWWQNEWPRYLSGGTPRTMAGVFLYEDSGSVKATLRCDARVGSLSSAANFGTSPVTVGTSGDVIRCKVERRYYVWRAKVWVDGGSEPGSWTLEGFLPHLYTNTNSSPSSIVTSQYPYSNADRDEWGQLSRSIIQWFPTVGCLVDAGTTGGSGAAVFDNVTVTYDPDGSTMVPMHMQLKKYDGTVNYGTVQLDGDRVVLASLAQHTFDNDFHGFTAFLWSDGGAPSLQPAVLSDTFIRAPLGVVFGCIKFP